VLTTGDHDDLRVRDLGTHAVELARLRAWIVGAMDHERRDRERVETVIEEVVVRCRGNLEPRASTGTQDRAPVVAVLGRELCCDARTETIGVLGHHREERPRARLLALDVKRFEHDPGDAHRIAQRHDRCDHRAVAVTPQRAAGDAHRIEQLLGLDRRGFVEARRQRVDPRRLAVAGAIRDHDPTRRCERGDLRIERIELVAPTAVQDHERRSGGAAEIANVKRRVGNRHEHVASVIDSRYGSCMTIELVLEARPRDLGGGLKVGRVLPMIARRFVGPFVFLDHMGPIDEAGMSVKPHPHLHLATVTYLFDGEILHRDSVGSKQLITPGAINWMVAGRGIAHSERRPDPDATHRMHGLQIWVGLPRAHEDVAPSFQHAPASTIPVIDDRGMHASVLLGTAFGVTSPVATLSPMFYADVRLAPGSEIAVPESTDRAAYVIDGAITVDDVTVEARHMAIFTRGATVVRAERAARLVLLGGEPLDGPRYMWWNFVSSSKDRIMAAAEDWRAGRFAKIPGDEIEFVPAPDGPRFATHE
jgi:redox-sensitive bicupin YhaK (pirin superfamily)